MGFTAFDIVFVFFVGGGLIQGLLRGFVGEVLSLLIWIAVVMALRFLHQPLAEALYGPIGTVSGAYVGAFALIVLVILVGGRMIAAKLSGGVRRSAVGALDRLLGAGFGALKGLVLVSLLYMTFSLLYDTLWGRAAARPEWVADARTYSLVHGASTRIVDLVEARRGPAEPHGVAGEGHNKARPAAR